MADVHEPEIRSYNMSQIRSKNTKPELVVRKFLHGNSFRYGLHTKSLPGTPDLVFRPLKTVIFIHGCFWHGHEGCHYFVIPKTRTEWWTQKIARNKFNDRKHSAELKRLGWSVITLHECDLKPAKREKTLTELLKKLIRIKAKAD
jgi:DNA mismatch endonuclease (patch repair protein)